jgi:D-glycero-D-manno-heptose 1,7-bisphosphate phosphatase
MVTQGLRRGIFFDRDGVLNQAMVKEGRPYPPTDSDSTVITPGARDLLLKLKVQGYFLCVITNQPDVARGTRTKENVSAINDKIMASLPLDELKVCFHDNKDNCACRKPKPGLILEAAKENAIDMPSSWLIGDRSSDIEAGRRAGCQTIF